LGVYRPSFLKVNGTAVRFIIILSKNYLTNKPSQKTIIKEKKNQRSTKKSITGT